MSSRSSTSSSRTLVERPRLTKAALVAIAVVLVVRVTLEAGSDVVRFFRGPTRDSSYINIEHNVVREGRAQPRVLLMGSSRMRYGMPEFYFADAAGLPRKDVENVAVQAGTPLTALWLLRRNPRLWSRTELIVIDTNRQMLRREPVRPRFYRLATLPDRLALDDPAAVVDAVADRIFRHRADRRSIGEWLRGLTGFMPEDDILSTYKDRGLWWYHERGAAQDPALRPENAARMYLGGFRRSEAMVGFMDELLAVCRARSVGVVIVHTPTTALYRHSFPRVPGALAANRIYMDWLSDLGRRTPVLVLDTLASTGLTEHDFIDYGHLTKHGARILTQTVVDELKKRSLLPRSL